MLAIGIMSGTSCDGADALILDIPDPSARCQPEIIDAVHRDYPHSIRSKLLAPDQLSIVDVAELHYQLPEFYAEVVRGLKDWQKAEVCGVHGQTVFHAPPSRNCKPCTLQLGSPSALAQHLGIAVVGEVRDADLALGGEAAPIVPIAHWFFSQPHEPASLIINIGGITNFTLVTPELEGVRASDLGPGMMVTDFFVERLSNGQFLYDDGSMSKGGVPHDPLVQAILSHPYLARPLPKTTGREDFGSGFASALLRQFEGLSAADLVCSSLMATAKVITSAEFYCEGKDLVRYILTGGGALNSVLTHYVRDLTELEVSIAGKGSVFAPQYHEPAAIALIAARTLRGLPSSLPQVTGASRPAVLGCISRA